MNTPQLSASPIGAPPALPLPDPEGAARLHLSGPVQVHIHVGQALPGPAIASGASEASSPQRRHPVLLALLALTLAGGGYWTGTRTATSPSAADAVAALAADPAPPLPPLPLGLPAAPGLAAAPGEVPQALRQQLARPPVVTPAPGTPGVVGTATGPGGAVPGTGSPPAPGAGAPASPARNPFGLGN